MAMTLDSAHTKKALQDLHENIVGTVMMRRIYYIIGNTDQI